MIYDQPPTTDEINRFFYRGLHLYLSADTTSQQVKDWWKECEIVCRWKLAQINNTVLDAEGRIIAPRKKAA